MTPARGSATGRQGGRSGPARKRAASRRARPASRRVETEQRCAILVLGMHRSGTSALTRVLGLAGAALPRTPMGASDHNARGFFESVPVYHLHEELLSELGSSWDDLSPLPEGWAASAPAQRFADRMADVVREEYGSSPLFVLKDPRLCRLVPFWLAVLERLEVEPRFVIPVRNPLEVSASLARAQGIDEQRGRLLWLQHFLCAERDTREHVRVVVTYDQLLEDWRRLLARVDDGLGLGLPPTSRRAAAEIDAFLSEALRHHELPSEGVEVRRDVAGWVKRTWRWAERAAAGRPLSPKTLDAVADAFFAAEEAFGPVVATSEQQRRSEAEEAARLRAALEAAEAAPSSVDVSLEAASNASADAAAPIAARLDDLVEGLNGLMAWIVRGSAGSLPTSGDEPVERLVGALDDAGRVRHPAQALLELAATRDAEEVAGLSRTLAERDAELERTREALRASADRLAEREREADMLRARGEALESLRETLAKTTTERDEWARVAAERNRELADLRALETEVEGLRERTTALSQELEAQARRTREREADWHEEAAVQRSHLESARAELGRVTERAERLEETLGARDAELGSLRERGAGLEAQISEQQQQLARLEERAAALAEAERTATRRRTELEAALDEREAQLVALREGLAEREAGAERDRATIEALEAAAAEARARTETLEVRAAVVPEQEERLRAQATELERLRGEALRVPVLRQRLLESEAARERAEEDVEEAVAARTRALRGAIEELEAEAGRLRVEASRVPGLRERLVAQEAKLERHEEELERLRKLRGELESARARVEALEAEREAEEARTLPGPRLAPREDSEVEALRAPEPLPRRLAKLAWWTLTFRALPRWKEHRTVGRLRASGLFDEAYYLANSPDLAERRLDPLVHYVRHGAAEGRDPSAAFDSDFYLATNPDVRLRGLNPLDHFASHGWKEGRNPHPKFDVRAYLEINTDVAASGENPLRHWLDHGWTEGRAFRRHPPRSLARTVVRVGAGAPAGASTGVGAGALAGAGVDRAPGSGREERSDRGVGSATKRPSRSEVPGRAAASTARRPVRRPPEPSRARFALETLDVEVERRSDPDDPTVLVVTHVLPHPGRAGNEVRIGGYVRWLTRRGFRVVTIHCPLPEEEPSAARVGEAAKALGNLIVCHRDGRVATCLDPSLASILGSLDGRPIQPLEARLARFAGESEREHRARTELELTFCPDALARLVLHLDGRLEGPRALITNYVWTTRILPRLGGETLSIVDTHDLFSSKGEKVAGFGVSGQLVLSETQEAELLRRGSVVMAIQPAEAQAFEQLVPDRRVLTVGVDFACAPDDHAPLPEAGTAPTLALAASDNAMNVKGLRDFLRHCWPLIRRDHPEARLRVAGAVGRAVSSGAAGVEMLGFVDSLAELYRGAHAVINPAAAGTGLKIKTLEALAHHRPVVAWPHGVEGIPEALLGCCSVANDWYEFYLAVSKAFSVPGGESPIGPDERARIGEALAAQNVYRDLVDLLDEHCETGSRARASA